MAKTIDHLGKTYPSKKAMCEIYKKPERKPTVLTVGFPACIL